MEILSILGIAMIFLAMGSVLVFACVCACLNMALSIRRAIREWRQQ